MLAQGGALAGTAGGRAFPLAAAGVCKMGQDWPDMLLGPSAQPNQGEPGLVAVATAAGRTVSYRTASRA